MNEKAIEKLAKRNKVPGLSMAVITQPNSQIATVATGIIDKSRPLAIKDDTLFEAASLSKPVFAYIVLKMVESGKFSLDEPLYKLSSGFGPPHLRNDSNYKLLTVRTILSHQAGLPNWQPEEYVVKPGEQFNYSGLAYSCLNDVIEELSGKTLEQLAQEVFQDLGMINSSFLPHKDGSLSQKCLAVGHKTNGDVDTGEHFPSGSRPNPAASLLTTATDYIQFLHTCMEDGFIRKHMFDVQIELEKKDKTAMDANVPTEVLKHIQWGLGMGLQTSLSGQRIAFHWGDSETNRSFAAINLDTNQAAVCLTNSANGPLLFNQLLEPFIGKLSDVSFWLSRREGLPFQHPQLPDMIPNKNLGFFKKLEDEDPEQHQNEDRDLQDGFKIKK